MSNFQFINAGSVDEAVKLLSTEQNACIAAGCTDITVDVRSGKMKDKTFISIDKLDELRGIKEEDGYVVIGALTCINEIGASEIVKEKAPVLYEAAQVFADPIIRNRATIGGNITTASPAADTAPCLLVLDAEVLLKSVDGERIVPITEWFVARKQLAKKENELITAIRFKPCEKSSFQKLGLRNAIAISIISSAAALKLSADGTVEECRVAMGAVDETPRRAYNAEKSMVGKKVDEASLKEMGEELQKDINPHNGAKASAFYRRNVGAVYASRALEAAAK